MKRILSAVLIIIAAASFAVTQEVRHLLPAPQEKGGSKIQQPGGMGVPRLDPKSAGQTKGRVDLPAKTPVAFFQDEVLRLPAVRLADGGVVRLLPRSDALHAQAIRNRMLLMPEQQRLRRTVLPALPSAPRPAVFDNMAAQTPGEPQGGRSTCGVFAAIAALEAAYKRAAGRDIDLSEQHTNWLKNVVWMSDGDKPDAPSQTDASTHENLPGSVSAGVSCVGILQMLTRYNTVADEYCPYNSNGQYEDFSIWPTYRRFGLSGFHWSDTSFNNRPINEWNFAPTQMPENASAYPLYGVREVVTLTPEEFHNPDMIEALVASGRDVVFAIQLYDRTASHNDRDPVWRHERGAAAGGAHCMVIVGYDRNRRFFVVKNSWGEGARRAADLDREWQDVAGKYDRYVLLDYDYLADVYEAGFINTPRLGVMNFEQRMLGAWDVTFSRKSTGEVVTPATIYWRQLIAPREGAIHHQLQRPSYRIGDLVFPSGRTYRVNGEMINARRLNLYVDFDRAEQPYYERSGVRIEAELRNREVGRPSIAHAGMFPNWVVLPFTNPEVFRVPLADLEFSGSRR